MSVRVRFAPSPTGSLHLGNARTAALNWLLARQTGGELVLRIEDSDSQRNVAGAESAILEDLAWLGVDWDEGPDGGGPCGPYRQSERTAVYGAALARLLESGQAYEHDSAVRFRVPRREVRFIDRLRGETGVGEGEIEDFVIGRSDGTATYQLAVVADDHAMRITDVVRGQDHLTNTPRQLLLYEALGWQPPRFAHLPLVLGQDRARLSKRHGATSVATLREAGVLPQSLLNYLVLLGWGPPDQHEVRTAGELLHDWRLDAVSSANAVFDLDKLDWLSQQHLSLLAPAQALEAARPFLAKRGLGLEGAEPWWIAALDLVRPGARGLVELTELLYRAFWSGPDGEFVPEDPATRAALEAFAAASRRHEMVDADTFRTLARQVAEATGLRGRGLFHPLRLATTGQEAGPDLGRLLPLIDAAARGLVKPAVSDVATRIQKALG